MGIPMLIQYMEAFLVVTSLRNVVDPGASIAIDLSCWLHAAVAAFPEDVLRGSFEKSVNYVVTRMTKFSESYCLYLVQDGPPPPEKKETKEKRKAIRDQARKELGLLEKKMNDSDRPKMRRLATKAVEVSSDFVAAVDAALSKKQNINIVKSFAEADQQLAYLYASGVVQIVVTLDSDLLLYGVPCLLAKLAGQPQKGRREFLNDLTGLYFNPRYLFDPSFRSGSGIANSKKNENMENNEDKEEDNDDDDEDDGDGDDEMEDEENKDGNDEEKEKGCDDFKEHVATTTNARMMEAIILESTCPLYALVLTAVMLGTDYNDKLPIGSSAILQFMRQNVLLIDQPLPHQIPSTFDFFHKALCGNKDINAIGVFTSAQKKKLETLDVAGNELWKKMDKSILMFRSAKVLDIKSSNIIEFDFWKQKTMAAVSPASPATLVECRRANHCTWTPSMMISYLHKRGEVIAQNTSITVLRTMVFAFMDMEENGINISQRYHEGFTNIWIGGKRPIKFADFKVPPFVPNNPAWISLSRVNDLIDSSPELSTTIIQKYMSDSAAGSKQGKDPTGFRAWKEGERLKYLDIAMYKKDAGRVVFFVRTTSQVQSEEKSRDSYPGVLVELSVSKVADRLVVDEITQSWCSCKQGELGIDKHVHGTLFMIRDLNRKLNKDFVEYWSRPQGRGGALIVAQGTINAMALPTLRNARIPPHLLDTYTVSLKRYLEAPDTYILRNIIIKKYKMD